MAQTAAVSEQQPETMPEVLTVDQAAEFLQFSRGHLYKLIRDGEIPSHRVGKRLRFTKRSLLAWIDQKA